MCMLVKRPGEGLRMVVCKAAVVLYPYLVVIPMKDSCWSEVKRPIVLNAITETEGNNTMSIDYMSVVVYLGRPCPLKYMYITQF